MSAAALLSSGAEVSDDSIRNAMSGNLCRCGTYGRINKAIKRAANAPKEA
jgi:isoquinoline 1-oxidoreductase alpha subunit